MATIHPENGYNSLKLNQLLHYNHVLQTLAQSERHYHFYITVAYTHLPDAKYNLL